MTGEGKEEGITGEGKEEGITGDGKEGVTGEGKEDGVTGEGKEECVTGEGKEDSGQVGRRGRCGRSRKGGVIDEVKVNLIDELNMVLNVQRNHKAY